MVVPFAMQTLQRLPLAEASYRMLDYLLEPAFLAELFQRHSGPAYEKVIRFPLFVHLVGDALLEHHGSGHKSFTRAQEEGTLTASCKAMYGKLARVPLSLSCALLHQTTGRLQELGPPGRRPPAFESLQEFTLVALDGKKIKHLAHRLKILRGVRGHVLAAKVVVALNLTTGLAVAMHADPDGEAGDAPLVPPVVTQVRACGGPSRLWVADRQFCDLNQPRLLGADGDHYLIRYSAKVGFHPDPSRPLRCGVDRQGRAYQEEWGWLGSPGNRRRQEVRRITLQRPGEEAVIVVTDLWDADRYPAADLLEVYLQRWGLERVFQRITEVFHLRRLIGSTPQAGVFQAAFCLLLYNLIVVLRAYISQAQKREPETISTENLFYDVQRQWVALHEVLSVEEIVAWFESRHLAGSALRQHVRGLLASQWSVCWLKAPANKKPSQRTEPRRYLKGGHTSVYRLLQQAQKIRTSPQ
jgi:Transposase DDE domain